MFNFQSLTKADDIRDFEIEGMSIGDSLLDYFSLSQITKELEVKNEYTYFYGTDYASISLWVIRDTFKIYDDIGVVIKTNDKNYKIYSLSGTFTDQSGKIEDCYDKQNIIAKDIEKIIDPKYKYDLWFVEKERLKSHQLSIRYVDFISSNGRRPFSIACFDITKDNDDYTLLNVSVDSEEFDKYLDSIN